MGVSLPGGGGGGRGRNLNADLNLVPFIDLLCTTITFLLATAVWNQTEALKVEQSISNEPSPPSEEEPTPPMVVHVRGDGVYIGRNLATGKNYPKLGETYDWTSVENDLKTDRDSFPDEIMVIITTDDGVNYEHMIKALDLTRAHGYEQTALSGGPASQNASRSMPPPG
jgi:biopolymer transport protein ExbD